MLIDATVALYLGTGACFDMCCDLREFVDKPSGLAARGASADSEKAISVALALRVGISAN